MQKAVSGEHARAIFFAHAVLIFYPCMRAGCALVLIFGSSCANVWAISTAVLSFGRLALCSALCL